MNTQPQHIVALSGGKDSTAMALRLAEIGNQSFRYICNETGDELPEMKAHWRKLEDVLGQPLERVRYRLDLYGAIEEQRMLPNTRFRWCTRLLKILPTLQFFKTLPLGSSLYVGLRADEELRTGIYGEGLTVIFPMRNWGWTKDDVFAYLQHRGVAVPKRTDCALCPFQRLGEWKRLYEEYPEIYARGIELEQQIGATIRNPRRDTWGTSLVELAEDFKQGREIRQHRDEDNKACRVCRL